jgi:hemoglobin
VSDLDSRTAIDALLLAFYGRALPDEVLGPVFRAAHMDLDTHLPRIAAFWERTLLNTGTYDGRPMQVHRHLTQTAGLAEHHYVRWLELWHQTLDARYAGPLATRAGEVAEQMATALQRDQSGPQDLPLRS